MIEGLQYIKTMNIRAFMLFVTFDTSEKFAIDGQPLAIPKLQPGIALKFEKVDGQWEIVTEFDKAHPLSKTSRYHRRLRLTIPTVGLIFLAWPDRRCFHECVRGDRGQAGEGQFPNVTGQAKQRHAAFAHVWDQYFRGKLPEVEFKPNLDKNLILFGDPASNVYIAKIIDKLPITWTKDKLIVNGVSYDAKTHMPILIYPNPLNPKKYVVINSGHTFTEADLKGTNANLYPHLGDWAVIKVGDKPEVVAAGFVR